MSDYEARQAARRERLMARAAALEAAADASYKRARALADCIPLGQPILVGHHSERRHRRDLAKIDARYRASFENAKAAADARRRAASVGKAGISSDDPGAIAKLRDELARCEAFQAQAKAINAVIRKHKAALQGGDVASVIAALIAAGCSQRVAEKAVQPDFCGRLGMPAYALSNNNANMRRIKQRIAQLEANAEREQRAEVQCVGFTVADNKDANRVQLFFPGKPSERVRDLLKSTGFHWNRGEVCWQRMWSDGLWASLTEAGAYLRVQLEQAVQS
jgi:hypothetical protein